MPLQQVGGRRDQRSLAPGAGLQNVNLTWTPKSVLVDNPGSAYVYFPQVPIWIDPGRKGVVFDWPQGPSGSQVLFRSDQAPAGATLPANKVTEPAQIWFLEDRVPASPGVHPVNQDIATVAMVDGRKVTGSIANSFTAATSPTDICCIGNGGSATHVTRITRIAVSAIQTTGGVVPIGLIRRSTRDTPTATASSGVWHDVNDHAFSATTGVYLAFFTSTTGNPTLGTSVQTLRLVRAFVAASTAMAQLVEWTFGTRPSEALVLRGFSPAGSDDICINLFGVAQAGAIYQVEVEWTEE
jgi:hypothetical protein